MFFEDGMIQWNFWGTWVVLIGTVLSLVILSFGFGSEGDLSLAVFAALTMSLLVFALLLFIVWLLSTFPVIVVGVSVLILFLYFLAWLGNKYL